MNDRIDNIADYLADRAVPSAKPEWIADILDRLVWLMDDNGREIHAAIIQWLSGDEKWKIEITLAMQTYILFDNRVDMLACGKRIVDRWPELEPVCAGIIQRWDEWAAKRIVKS